MASTRPDSTAARGPLSDSIQQQQSKIIVLKIGTSTICDEKTFIPKLSNLSLLVEAIVGLRNRGHQVILVSSGAVGVGLRRLSLSKRPKHLAQVQVGCSARLHVIKKVQFKRGRPLQLLVKAVSWPCMTLSFPNFNYP